MAAENFPRPYIDFIFGSEMENQQSCTFCAIHVDQKLFHSGRRKEGQFCCPVAFSQVFGSSLLNVGAEDLPDSVHISSEGCSLSLSLFERT
jgi:hypothetical protein